jgi:hypothetical protein
MEPKKVNLSGMHSGERFVARFFEQTSLKAAQFSVGYAIHQHFVYG